MRQVLTFFLVVVSAAFASAQISTAPYAFSTIAGSPGAVGSVDGMANNARFNRPWGIAVDAAGNVYVSEAVNHTVRKITPSGIVSTMAGEAGMVGTVDGVGSTARFGTSAPDLNGPTNTLPTGPYGLAVGTAAHSNLLIVADGNSHTIRRIGFNGIVDTYAGAAASPGFVDGVMTSARFRLPTGVAVNASGTLFIADSFNHVIRQITSANVVTTIAGSVGTAGTADGTGANARFLHPTAIAIAPSGDLYVTDSANTIRRLSPVPFSTSWQVTTIAGTPFTYGTADGVGAAARFGGFFETPVPGRGSVGYPTYYPTLIPSIPSGVNFNLGDLGGIAVDGAGDIYVSDSSNNTIRRITPGGTVTTIGAVGGTTGAVNGVGTAARFARPCGIAVTATGTLYIADLFNQMIRKGEPAAAPSILSQPSDRTALVGETVTLTVQASGSPIPTYTWRRNGITIAGATSSTLTLPNVQAAQAGTYVAAVQNELGSVNTIAVTLTVVAPPRISSQPVTRTVVAGETVVLSVTATGTPAPTYQWFRDGTPIPSAINQTLVLENAQEATIGSYTVAVTNSVGSVTSNATVVAVRTARLVNLSIRCALAGNEILIVGFVPTMGTKSMLVRAIGPALGNFGVAGAMADPQLSLFDQTALVTANDNWSTSGSAAQVIVSSAAVGAFGLAPASLDAAALITSANPITAQASARNGVGGVVLVEVYDAASTAAARLVNASARTKVGVGENAVFAGFAVTGNSPKRLLVRAVGPTLAAFGVEGVLRDPRLDLFGAGSATAFAGNDNWNGDATLRASFTQVGAFSLPDLNSRDAAVIVSLSPGSYTARVTGVGDTTGEVLLEIYELP